MSQDQKWTLYLLSYNLECLCLKD